MACALFPLFFLFLLLLLLLHFLLFIILLSPLFPQSIRSYCRTHGEIIWEDIRTRLLLFRALLRVEWCYRDCELESR